MEGLRVEALDAAGLFRELLGFAVTNNDGRFRMEMLQVDLVRLVGKRAVVAYLRVIDEPSGGVPHVLADTRQSGPKWPLDGRATSVVLRASAERVLARLPALIPFVVSGTVHDEDGPMPATAVALYDRSPDDGSLAPLMTSGTVEASGTTDARGHYRITYLPPAEGKLADLVVRAVVGDPHTDTEARCHAPPSLIVNIVKEGDLWRGPSTFTKTWDALDAAGAPVTDLGSLDAGQRERFACSARLPLADVTALSVAHAVAEASAPLEPEVVFAALARGMGTDRDSFFQHPKRAIKEALRSAIAANQVPQRYAREVDFDDAIENWVAAAAAWSLESRSDPCGLNELLAVAEVSDGTPRTSFAEQFCANESAMPDFWDGPLGLDTARIQLTFQWWSLARGHLPLIEKLEAMRAAATEPTLVDLAKFSEADWRDILDSLATGAPPSIPGADATERKHNYARVLYTTMANAFPTKVFGKRVAATVGEPVRIQSFFDVDHPDFELGKHRLSLEPYRTTVAAMPDVEDQKRIKSMERVFRFAPTYERASALLEKGYDSAHRVHAAGKQKFFQEMSGALGDAVADEIFAKACWQASASSAVFAQFGLATHKGQPRIFPNFLKLSGNTLAEGNEIPDYQTLFGSAGGCSCTHCAGVLGPAAYLTDSLIWLNGFDSELPKSGSTKWSALDILVGSDAAGTDPPEGRRPELALLELTCKSAHTPLPYIDIANEILELAVAKDAGVDVTLGSVIKTTYEPEELAAGPEILYEEPHIGAWRSLLERRHPFSLPVCLFDRESDAYLAYLGITRADIVEALGGDATELAKARLGVRDDVPESPAVLPLSGWGILIGEDSGTALEHWGEQSAENLEAVPTFLTYAGLTFPELEELLATRYVNGDDGSGAPGLAAIVLDPDDGCDTSEMSLDLGADEPEPEVAEVHLLRLHRFLRLRLHTGLSSTDLDLLLAAFSPETDPPQPIDITATMLEKVTEAQALAKDLKMTVREVAALFADLDIHERWEKKSPYRQYFLNRLVDSPVSTVFADVLTTPASAADLSGHKSALQQGLGLTGKELLLLVDGTTLATELLLPAGELVLSNLTDAAPILPRLSKLWRTARFARALGLRIADYLVVRAYSGLTPIGPTAAPSDARAFIECVRDWKALKLSTAELQWVLRAFAPPSSGLAADAADIEALRSEITSAVRVIESETETTEDPDDRDSLPSDGRGRAFALLGELLWNPSTEHESRDQVFEVLQGWDDLEEPPPEAPWRDRIDLIAKFLPGDLDEEGGAKDLLAGPVDGLIQGRPYLRSSAERFAYVAKALDRHVRASRAVAEKIASASKLSLATVTHVLKTVLRSQGTPESAHRLIDDFLPANKTGADAADQDKGLQLVLRHARMLVALRVAEPLPRAPEPLLGTQDNPGELSWVYPLTLMTPALRELPAVQPDADDLGVDDRARFAMLLKLARRVGLRDRMTGGAHALREVLESTPIDFELARPFLASKSGWDLPAIISLCASFSIETTASLIADDNLLKLERGIAFIRRLGIDADDVLAFLNLESELPAAVEFGLQPTTGATKNARDLVIFARRAAKAKLSSEAWSEVAKRVRDPFRELLRDRLVDALVPSAHATREALYGFHLIDIDMSACMMTSRIVQATNALQVFVQRSFLGLDADVKLPEQATKQWEWRKAYRVWEANRKVFLWPENWLEPDLRDDMTPLFRDFQTHLGSGEITDASAERAMEKYLTGLHEIARLEPMALWYDEEAETDHVVARTRSQPRKWFYRQRVGEQSWTPWEKADLDIDAESVLLVGANRRLYLFWPQLVLKNDPRAPASDATNEIPMPPHPVADDDDDEASFKAKIYAYYDELAAWQESQANPEQPEAPEQTQHYEVRAAWSSQVDGAWTPRRLSDCSPLVVPNAVNEAQLGYRPEHIVFVLAPLSTEPPEGAIRILCVVTPWFVLMSNNVTAGTLHFDACGGGRWTSKLVAAGSPASYQPTSPANARLVRTGFQETGIKGSVQVPHLSLGQSDPSQVAVLEHNAGRFVIVSPSSHSPVATHAFHRFTLDDGKRVFHARQWRASTPWTAPASTAPGQVADMVHPGDKLAQSISDAVVEWAQSQAIQVPTEAEATYVFELFEHPYVCEFANRLAADGIPGLLGWSDDPDLSAQFLHEDITDIYDPTPKVVEFPMQEVSFELGNAYGLYNWELFFHVPFTIAQRLSQEGRYADAQKWFHYIFNPTSGVNDAGPRRFWRVKPFYEIDDITTIQEDLTALAVSSSFAASLKALVNQSEATQKAANEMKRQIDAMTRHPFAPHVLARMRPLAYMKNVFMRYVQNLLDWGDSLFRRDTMESIHEALTLYLLAADLLGPKPDLLKHKADPPGKTFEELAEAGLDVFGNAAIEIEPLVPKFPPPGFKCADDGPPVPDARLYFCIPPNEQLYGYWDLVADRLFKIRNCMNIEGVARDLALFAPPIDPAILVRAFAAGVRLDQVLDALAAPSPLYRFVRLHAKAVEFAGAVQSLGQALIAALEKKDGEELALVRQRHELAVLDAEREIRKQAIQEASATLEGLSRSRQIAETRLQYYVGLIDTGLLSQEKDAEAKTRTAKDFRKAAAAVNELDTFLAAIPDISLGIAAAATIGGRALQQATGAVSRKLSSEAESLNTDASLAQTAAGYARRAQEWKLQKSVGEKELRQLDKQIAAQEIRLAIAERELETLDLRRDHAREIDAFFRSKFTSHDLYTWMTAQVGAEHYRAYQTAYDMAKRAERAYQLERGDETTSFIRFGAWDSLKKGLLSGERLLQDLRALDAAYLSRSDREREITKHVSLSEIAGEALTTLRDTGTAELDLHTYHFDADYPGHYFRRLKTVAISVATVRPAADGVQCELTLLKSAYRKTSQIGGTEEPKPYPGEPYTDELHRSSTAAIKGLVTSTAENDPGLFEVSLKDEMLLPFEGSGVVSQWRIEIDPRTNRFPMHRISDVVLHLRYTARDGGPGLKGEALAYAQQTVTPVAFDDPPTGLKQRTRVFSARRDFDEAWAVFTAGTFDEDLDEWVNRLELPFAQRHFRSFFGNPKVKIVGIQVSATFNEKYPPPPAPPESVAYELARSTASGTVTLAGALEFRGGEPSSPAHDKDSLYEAPDPPPDPPLPPLPVDVLRDDDEAFEPWSFTVETASTPDDIRSATDPRLLKPDAFEGTRSRVRHYAAILRRAGMFAGRSEGGVVPQSLASHA